MHRRKFLEYVSLLSAQAALTSAFAKSLMIENAFGADVPVDGLRRAMNPVDGIVLVPADKDFKDYQSAFNKRTLITPAVRVLCRTTVGVTVALQWAKDNHVPLALRAGGHSYEGFSQSRGLVIDTRMMNIINLSTDATTFRAGAGANLGMIYKVLAAKGVVIPAGSCPTVGMTGHTTGGGYGLIARGFGLACDSLLNIDMVLADGRAVSANERENPDLFWAMRGAGGGSFGIVTRMQFRTHKVRTVLKFVVKWRVKAERAAAIMRTWQEWAPNAPNAINPLLKVSRSDGGMYELRCIGQSIGTEAPLRVELNRLVRVVPASSVAIEALPFLGAVHKFGGSETADVSVYMKAKSDYLKNVWNAQEALGFLSRLPEGKIVAIFDSYGGAIRNLRDTDTAFAHREKTISSVQYYMQWRDPADTNQNLSLMRNFHDSVRPYFSGGMYSNYPDLDLPDYAEAYWGNNLDRLIQIKNSYDPANVFKHAQSVPTRRA